MAEMGIDFRKSARTCIKIPKRYAGRAIGPASKHVNISQVRAEWGRTVRTCCGSIYSRSLVLVAISSCKPLPVPEVAVDAHADMADTARVESVDDEEEMNLMETGDDGVLQIRRSRARLVITRSCMLTL